MKSNGQALMPYPWSPLPTRMKPRTVPLIPPPGVPISDAHWRSIGRHLPLRKIPWLKRKRKGGRPRFNDRLCFEALLWLLWNGLSWRQLPAIFGTRATLNNRVNLWMRRRLLSGMFIAYLEARSHSVAIWHERLSAKDRGFVAALLCGAASALL